MAPFVFHADVIDVPLGSGTPMTAKYEWDFGDPSGSHDRLVGWNAAHVYDNPGTYTVGVVVTDEAGRVGIGSVRVDVQPDTRTKIYIASMADLNSHLRGGRYKFTQNNTEYLFQRGQVFAITNPGNTIDIEGLNITVGSYGSGALPAIEWRNDVYQLFYVAPYCINCIIQDLRMTNPSNSSTTGIGVSRANANFPASRNTLIRNNEFGHFEYAISTGGAGVLVQANRANRSSINEYFVYMEGKHTVILGNDIDMTYANNRFNLHVVRGSANLTLVAFNHFKAGGGTSPSPLPNNAKDILVSNPGNTFEYIYGNILEGAIDIREYSDGIVLEKNIIGPGLGDNGLEGNSQINIKSVYAKNISIRDNLMRYKYYAVAIGVAMNGTIGSNENILINRNTGVSTDPDARMINVLHSNTVNQVTLENNLNLVPETGNSTNVASAAADMSAFKSIDGNIWSSKTGNCIANISGCKSIDQWNAVLQVGDDVVGNYHSLDDLPANAHMVTVGGVTAGADLSTID